MIEHDSTYEASMRALITKSFEGNIRDAAGAEGKRLQLAEDNAWSLYGTRWLNAAIGVQLDHLGVLLGEKRRGRVDADYRDVLIAIAAISQTSITGDAIVRFVVDVVGGNITVFQEQYPASIRLGIGNAAVPDVVRRVRDLVGAGIGVSLTANTGRPLLLAGVNITAPDYQTYIAETGYMAEYNHDIDKEVGTASEVL